MRAYGHPSDYHAWAALPNGNRVAEMYKGVHTDFTLNVALLLTQVLVETTDVPDPDNPGQIITQNVSYLYDLGPVAQSGAEDNGIPLHQYAQLDPPAHQRGRQHPAYSYASASRILIRAARRAGIRLATVEMTTTIASQAATPTNENEADILFTALDRMDEIAERRRSEKEQSSRTS